jgi:hypothetical protein
MRSVFVDVDQSSTPFDGYSTEELIHVERRPVNKKDGYEQWTNYEVALADMKILCIPLYLCGWSEGNHEMAQSGQPRSHAQVTAQLACLSSSKVTRGYAGVSQPVCHDIFSLLSSFKKKQK